MTDLNIERQVRTVLETLQAQTPKHALNLCEKYLKKNISSSQLIAVKALLLVYIGKDVEGLELAKNLLSKKPTDLTTLGNLDKVFVAANDYKLSVTMFEEAFRLVATEDIGSLLFFSVMRSQDAKHLFSIALKLHSMFKGERYLFWAIMALHIQTRTPGISKEDVSKSLKLAEKMIVKAFAIDKIGQRSYEELLLLIQTLQATDNNKEALRIFESSQGIKFANEDERLLLHIELLERNHAWDEAVSRLDQVLRSRGIFDWTLWKLYSKAINSCKDKPIQIASLNDLLDAVAPLSDTRTLQLARIDASIVFNDGIDETMTKVFNYLEMHINKEVCIPDMQHTAKALAPDVILRICEECRDQDGVNWSRLRRLLRSFLPKPVADSGDSAIAMFKSKSNEWMLHIANCFVDQYMDANHSISELLYAVECCKRYLTIYPDDFASRLLLILLFIHLGSCGLALDIFRSLDIKQLQLDTLAFIISDHIIELGEENAEAFFHESFILYDENRTASWSFLAEAFGRSSYHNIGEFYEFARRLEYSVQAIACICGSIRFELLNRDFTAIVNYLGRLRPDELLFDENFIRNLSDNRDRDVFDFCDHSGIVSKVLLESLPSFGLTSIVVYTFLPIALRSLVLNETDRLKVLSEKFDSTTKLFKDKPINERESCRLDLVTNVINLFSSYAESELDLNAFTGHLLDICNTINQPIPSLDINQSPYALLSSWQMIVEQDRWMSLIVASFIKGQSNSKNKRHARLLLIQLIRILESKCCEHSKELAELEKKVRILESPVKENENANANFTEQSKSDMIQMAKRLSNSSDLKIAIRDLLSEILGESRVDSFQSSVFGVLPAERGDGTEGLLIMAPHTVRSGHTNICGISFLLSIALQYKKYKWWSRDLVFLVPGIGEKLPPRVAVEDWLSAYHEYVTGKRLLAGALQAGLSIELDSGNEWECGVAFGDPELYIEGPDGLLPNLDLINTLVTIQRHRGKGLRIGPEISLPSFMQNSYLQKVFHVSQMIWRQAIDPGFAHGPLLRYRIDAVTLTMKVISTETHTLEHADRNLFEVVELTLRSLNNILEHLHQSFFFYLLVDNEHYISIANYAAMGVMPIIAMMIRFIVRKNSSISKVTIVFVLFLALNAVSLVVGSMTSMWLFLVPSVSSILLSTAISIDLKVLRSFCCFIAALSLSILVISNFGLSVLLAMMLGPFLVFSSASKFKYLILLIFPSAIYLYWLVTKSSWINGKTLLYWNAGIPFVVFPALIMLLPFGVHSLETTHEKQE